MAKEKITGVQWNARSYLADTEFMDRGVECTYNRLLQYIYQSQDQLRDDDAKMWSRCKCKSIREYRKHKAELMKPRGLDPATGEQIPPRIVVEMGFEVGVEQGVEVPFLRSAKCTEVLGIASRFRKQKSDAGKASAQKTKALKNQETGSTAVGTGEATESPRETQRGANGAASGGTTTSISTSKEALASSKNDPVLIARIADELWAAAGHERQMDRLRASGGATDKLAVIGWLNAGYSEAEIIAAGKTIIAGAGGEIRNLWKYLGSAIHDRIAKAREASAPAREIDPNAELRAKAKAYFQRPMLDSREEVVGWTLKPAAERKWLFGGIDPTDARFEGREVFDAVAKELGVADWPPSAGDLTPTGGRRRTMNREAA